ncbi:MAG: APC family permease [Blautia sp.]
MEENGKKLGLWNIIGLGLGGAIGTGIFMMLGYGIALTGRSIMLVCAVGCFYMLLAYWYNLAIPTMFVIKSGDYGMKAMLLGPTMTGVSSLLWLIVGFGMASYAITIATFLSVLFPALEAYINLAAFIILTLSFATTIKGSRFVTLLSNYIMILLIIALALFVGLGVPHVDAAAFFSNSDGGFWLNGFGGFISAISIMGFACQGTTSAPISMAAVTKNPKKTIPMAIIVITGCLAIIYGLMGYVAAGVLPYDQVAGANISVTAKVIMNQPLYLFFVVGGGICAIGTSVLASLGMIRYPVLQIAEDGWLPAVFKKVNKDGYPYVGYLTFYVIGSLPILIGMDIDSIISFTMVPTMLLNVYMNLKCITLPKKFPEQWEKRSIRIPLWLFNVCSVLGAAAAFIVAYNLFVGLSTRDMIMNVAVVVILAGIAIVRLKQGAVDPEVLKANKKEILDAALADGKENG